MKYSNELEQMSNELKLLLKILRTKNLESTQLNLNDYFMDIDWDQFLYLVFHHRVHPLIYLKLKNVEKKLIPAYVIQTLYQEYQKNTFQMLNLSGEMEQVSVLFNENNIRTLFLKGPVIAEYLYGDLSLRTSKDLDILIPIEDLEKAEELLLFSGYERIEFPTPFWKLRYHHVTYYNPQKRIYLEIHWRLHPQSVNEPNFNDLWKRKRKSSLTDSGIYFLGKEDLFLYLITHGGRHGWFRLRWLMDIDQFIREKSISEENIIVLQKYLNKHFIGQKHYLGQALILVSNLILTPINENMQSFSKIKGSRRLADMTISYTKERACLNLTMSEEDLAKYDNKYIIKIKPNIQKLILITKLIYPNPKDAEVLVLPKYLQFLYIPLRPILWLLRKIRRNNKIRSVINKN